MLLCELCRMVGSPYCPADLQEISWRDLQWVELERRAGRILVQEEIVEDDTGMITSVVIPTPVLDDAMEEPSNEESSSSRDN